MRRLLPSVRLASATATRFLRGGALVVLALLVATCGGEKGMGPGEQPTKLAFSVEPSSTTAGEPIATIRVEARNASNSLVSGYTGAVSVAIAGNPAAGTLSGTVTVNAVGGVATFDDLEINKSGVGYTLSASASGLAAATSAAFDIDAGPASKLAYSVQPTSSTAGEAIAPALEIEARDAFDNLDPNFTGDITVAITGGTGTAGAALSGTMSVTAVAGIATFNDLSIDKSGTGYTLVVTSDALPAGTSAPFDIDAGAATQLAFRVEPSSVTAGAPITPAVEVMAMDALGNTATAFTGDVTVAIAGPAPAAAAGPDAAAILSGTTTVAAVGGFAIFDNLIIDEAGTGYALTAMAGALTAATSGSFDVTVGQAAQLLFTVHPSNALAGAAIAPAVQVAMQDALGNTVTSFTGDVSLSIATNPAAGTLSGTTTVVAAAGVATFDDLSIDKAGNGYSLSATGGGLTGASAGFTIAAGSASQLAFTAQPVTTTAGATIAIQVTARDALGNTDPGFTGDVTVAITAGTGTAGATLSGTQTRTAVSGVATFNDLSIDMVGSSYSLSASASGVSDATSASFDITTGVATQLVFSVEPSNAMAGATIAPAVQVTAQDAQGNTATAYTGDVTVAITGGTGAAGAILSGPTRLSAVAGVATFSGLSIDKAGTGYTLTATDGSLTGATSASFDIAPGSSSQLAFTVQPINTTAGAAIAVEVSAKDPQGNTDPNFTGDVTVAITAGTGAAGATLSGTQTMSAVAGVATFTDLSIDKSGNGYTLSATATGIPVAGSSAFNITAGSATQLAFAVEPSHTIAAMAIDPAVQVTALDAFGNTDTGFSGGVTVAVGNNPGGGVLSGTLAQAAVAGVATFSDLSIDKAGMGYTLEATSTGLSAAISAAFDISSGAVSQLAFTTEPVTTAAGDAISVEVTARDAQNNTVTDFTGNVSVVIATNPAGGTLSGTTMVAAEGGVATFTDLSIDKVGLGYGLQASFGSVNSPLSAAFDITAAAASQLVFTEQPTPITAGDVFNPAVQVTALDPFGNVATGFAGDITVDIGANPGSGNLLGTATVAAASGIANFSDISIDKSGADYTLTAASNGLTGATSAAFDVDFGAASQLAFTVDPVNTTAGAAIPAVQVTAQDAFQNTVTSFASNIEVRFGSNPVSGTLSGTKIVQAVGGVSTFSDLSVDKSGTGYTLVAMSTGLGDVTSAAFEITPGAASQLAFTVEPVDQTAGAALSVEVTARDAQGNTDPNYAGDVTVAIAGGSGAVGATLSGTATQTAASGVATFTNLSIDLASPTPAGTNPYTLTATDGSLAGGTSAAFEIVAGAATQLAFAVEPTTAMAGNGVVGGVIAVTVVGQDGFGNTDPSFSDIVTLGFVNDPTQGTAMPATLYNGAATAANGVATFSNLAIDRPANGYTLQGTSGALTSPVSNPFDIVAGPAAALFFTVQPSQTTENAGISPAVQATARDQLGNTATGFAGNVVISQASGPGTLKGTFTRAAQAGVATFPGLNIDLVGDYTLQVASGSLTPAVSDVFQIIASVPTQLFFQVQPGIAEAGNGTDGGSIPNFEVVARDASGQMVTSFADPVTVAIITNPSGGTLFGTATVTPVGGVALFSGLSIDKAGVGYKLQATTASLPATESAFFNNNPGPVDHLVFNVQPSTAAVSPAVITPQVEVTALDVLDNVATSFSGPGNDVTLSITAGTGAVGAVLTGGTATASNGIAAFPSVSIDLASPGYTLDASAGAVIATSAPFEITTAAPSQLAFVQQPTSQTAGVVISPAITVDAGDPSFTGDVTVSITAGTGTSGAVLSGTATVAAVGGVATFNDLSINRSGFGYRLSATASGFAGTTSNPTFAIGAGPATQLDFNTQPLTATAGEAIAPFTVRVLDALGNRVSSFVGDVTLAIADNPGGGTLSGTATIPVVEGNATFSDLSIEKSGTGYRLDASSTGLTGELSDAFSINGAVANRFIFSVQPSNAGAGAFITPNVRVTALDVFDNVATSFAGNVTLSITSGTGTPGAVLGGITTQAAASGVAIFSGLSIDLAGSNYTLSATDGVLPVVESIAFTIN